MWEFLYASQQRPINNILQQAATIGDLMPDKRNQYKSGGNINIAKDKSAINTGTGAAAAGNISGTLNLNLAALRETEDPKDKELVDLISQLRSAIEAPDCALDDRFKQRALLYLDNLASLAKDQPEDLLKSAKDNLDDLADIADKGSKLANFAKEHLPTFTAAIAALRLWFGLWSGDAEVIELLGRSRYSAASSANSSQRSVEVSIACSNSAIRAESFSTAEKPSGGLRCNVFSISTFSASILGI